MEVYLQVSQLQLEELNLCIGTKIIANVLFDRTAHNAYKTDIEGSNMRGHHTDILLFSLQAAGLSLQTALLRERAKKRSSSRCASLSCPRR